MDLLFFYQHTVTVPHYRASQKSRNILVEDQLFSLLVLCGSLLRWSPVMVGDPVPTHYPSLLLSSDVSVLYQFGFPYLFLCSCVSFCGTWYTVGSVLMCFRELCSTPIMCPLCSTPTQTYRDTHTYTVVVVMVGDGVVGGMEGVCV